MSPINQGIEWSRASIARGQAHRLMKVKAPIGQGPELIEGIFDDKVALVFDDKVALSSQRGNFVIYWKRGSIEVALRSQGYLTEGRGSIEVPLSSQGYLTEFLLFLFSLFILFLFTLFNIYLDRVSSFPIFLVYSFSIYLV